MSELTRREILKAGAIALLPALPQFPVTGPLRKERMFTYGQLDWSDKLNTLDEQLRFYCPYHAEYMLQSMKGAIRFFKDKPVKDNPIRVISHAIGVEMTLGVGVVGLKFLDKFYEQFV